jgi:hypothetical protein
MALDSQAHGIANANTADEMMDTTDARWWARQDSNV